jgi:hypothetical protein
LLLQSPETGNLGTSYPPERRSEYLVGALLRPHRLQDAASELDAPEAESAFRLPVLAFLFPSLFEFLAILAMLFPGLAFSFVHIPP